MWVYTAHFSLPAPYFGVALFSRVCDGHGDKNIRGAISVVIIKIIPKHIHSFSQLSLTLTFPRLFPPLQAINPTQFLFPIRWCATEVFLRGVLTKASDVWAFGVLIFEILSAGRIPYEQFSNKVRWVVIGFSVCTSVCVCVYVCVCVCM